MHSPVRAGLPESDVIRRSPTLACCETEIRKGSLETLGGGLRTSRPTSRWALKCPALVWRAVAAADLSFVARPRRAKKEAHDLLGKNRPHDLPGWNEFCEPVYRPPTTPNGVPVCATSPPPPSFPFLSL